MRFVLEHLKSQTIPHDMMEELIAAGTRFYEGCLIVQVQDHKSNSASSSSSTSSGQDGDNVPSSIHNHNPYLTPSPCVPYPKKAEASTSRDASNGNSEQGGSSESKEKGPSKPNIFHVVLFPTPLTMHEEVIIQANTVDPRQNGRKQSTAVPRTPASATVPPTPSSAIPPTPSTTGPPAKKQKMSISGNELHAFESKIIQSTALPLFLDPVENIGDAQTVIGNLTDSRHKEPYPAPKVKKRTVAELAADEAIAAQEQEFMLIMDERYTSGLNGAKTGPTDGESGIPTFQPNFEQFNALKEIRKDRAVREAEMKQAREASAQAIKLRHEQQEQAAKQVDMERRAAQVAQDQAQMHNLARQAQLAREIQARDTSRHLNPSQNQLPHGHGHPMPNGVSRAQNSSPVVRNGTPNANSSPLVGNVPMNVTSSAQGVTSSPARPPSAMQQGQTGGIAMGRSLSRQQAPSRTGTPQMNGTPGMPHATPRMPQGSPPIVTSATTMNHSILANQHMNPQPPHFSPEQQAHNMEQRRIQQMYAQRRQQMAAQQMQNGSPPTQMSPEQHNPAHMSSLQHQATMNQQRSTLEYQQRLRMHHAAMGNGPGGYPNMPNGASPPQQHPQQGHPPPQPQLTPQQRQFLTAQKQQITNTLLGRLAQRYNGNLAAIPEAERIQCEQRAVAMAQEGLKKQMVAQQQRMREQHQQMQIQQHMASMNGMNGMNGPGMQQGMNGVGVQGMTEQQKHAMLQGMQQMNQLPHLGGSGVQNVNGLMHNQHLSGGGMGGMS